MINIAIFGAGGLGRSMARLISIKKNTRLVCILDSNGYAFDQNGIDYKLIENVKNTVANIPNIGFSSENAIEEVIEKFASKFNGIFIALPNLPNSFIPEVSEKIALSKFKGVIVDALKRTTAVELLSKLDNTFNNNEVLYVTGAGATPGMLSAVASIAAQSYVDIMDITITFGVGISNWNEYRATIREDIAHLEGFNPDIVSKMTEEEVEAELEKRNGILELVNMEHADDIILELAGVCSRDKVNVGGIVDTRNPKKPLSTNVKITGLTLEGKLGTHVFTLSDNTTMSDNVNGPALGYMASAYEMYQRKVFGFMTSADIGPKFLQTDKNKLEQLIKEKELVNA
ncbi:MAG: saccharopine dehydrogenase-like oxidoreductase [Cyanobacteriota bacterium]